MAGDVDGPGASSRTPEGHGRRGIDLRLHRQVTGLDLGGQVRVPDHEPCGPLGFDTLVLATRATPGAGRTGGRGGVFGVQTLADGSAPSTTSPVGGRPGARHRPRGRLHRCGDGRGNGPPWSSVTLVDRPPPPRRRPRPRMGPLVRKAMIALGIDVRTSPASTRGRDGRRRSARLADRQQITAHLVVLGTVHARARRPGRGSAGRRRPGRRPSWTPDRRHVRGGRLGRRRLHRVAGPDIRGDARPRSVLTRTSRAGSAGRISPAPTRLPRGRRHRGHQGVRSAGGTHRLRRARVPRRRVRVAPRTSTRRRAARLLPGRRGR